MRRSLPLARPRSAAVITGAAGGIGAATAAELARRGVRVALVERDAEGAERAATRIREQGGIASVHPADVTDEEAMTQAASDVVAEHGGVHILVNCAGVSILGTFAQLTLAEFEWLLRINLWGTVVTTKAFLPHLQAAPTAHVANVSSGYGLVAPAGRTPYVTSKFAVRGFTDALRHELAGSSVSAGTVFPGGVKTVIAMTARVAAAVAPEVGRRAAEAQTSAYRTTPERAAEVLVRGIERRRARVLIGTDARILDLLGRVAPSGSGTLLSRALRDAIRT